MYLGATINFAVPFLATKAFYLAETHSFHAYCQKRLFHRLGFKGLDDRLDFFHRAKSRTRAPNGKNRFLRMPLRPLVLQRICLSQPTRLPLQLRSGSDIVRFCVRIFSPARQAKSESSSAARADSSKADRNRANPESVSQLRDNPADHWL